MLTEIWASAVAGRIYLLGGVNWDASALATVEAYDPINERLRVNSNPIRDTPTSVVALIGPMRGAD